ncbi:hypothetical protein [Rhodococcus sp. BH5]|uniref:hypothetical protein n=1 Tax=Rhodococcus sp. BH5 TaxID=2871702 RepID=UPI0022CDADE7|nr:hypothetical protein [Rhodococcus sp. BH5]MCZ9634943.1 hypothetical protein [Rhodococcus sp. BH5]
MVGPVGELVGGGGEVVLAQRRCVLTESVVVVGECAGVFGVEVSGRRRECGGCAWGAEVAASVGGSEADLSRGGQRP